MAVYVRENLNVHEIPEIDYHRPSEDIWIKAYWGGKRGS